MLVGLPAQVQVVLLVLILLGSVLFVVGVAELELAVEVSLLVLLELFCH
jgi:hypothetical protein